MEIEALYGVPLADGAHGGRADTDARCSGRADKSEGARTRTLSRTVTFGDLLNPGIA